MDLERIFPVSDQICILDLANNQPHLFVPYRYREKGIDVSTRQFRCICLPASQSGIGQLDAFDWRLRTTLGEE